MLILSKDKSRCKTCSCPFIRYFRTLFWDILSQLFVCENYVNKLFIGPKQVFLLSQKSKQYFPTKLS